MDTRAVLAWAQRRMADADDGPPGVGYRYYHGERVGSLAVGLAERLGMDVDGDLLYVAGVLHDIGKSGYQGAEPHGPRGAAIVRDEATAWFSADELARVCLMIERHYARVRGRWYETLEKPTWPAEVLLIQDADILDHFGCNHVWQAFLWSGHLRRSPRDTLAYYWTDPHEQEWRKEAHRALNYDVAREELARRLALSDAFCRDFALEQEGALGAHHGDARSASTASDLP